MGFLRGVIPGLRRPPRVLRDAFVFRWRSQAQTTVMVGKNSRLPGDCPQVCVLPKSFSGRLASPSFPMHQSSTVAVILKDGKFPSQALNESFTMAGILMRYRPSLVFLSGIILPGNQKNAYLWADILMAATSSMTEQLAKTGKSIENRQYGTNLETGIRIHGF